MSTFKPYLSAIEAPSLADVQAWQSLTLANGGLIHIAFGAILGVAAFSRGQDKVTPPKKTS